MIFENFFVEIRPRNGDFSFGGSLETSMYKRVCFTLANISLDVS